MNDGPTTAKKTPAAAPKQRPDARSTRAGIGDLMAGVSLTSPPKDAQTEQRKHPIGSGIAFERVEEIYRMDPRKIVLEGAYVRQFIEDATFHQLRAAVRLERDIGQHLGVRLVGPPTEQRRVLVYGMRRWKAALAEGLERVPVRDYGRISEEKAIELQMLENEIRADPHPIDTALGFYLLSRQPEWSQKRISELFDKNKGYVSEMVRVGEALASLDEAARAPLYTAPAVTVRAFQSVAQVKDVGERRQALLSLLDARLDERQATTSSAEVTIAIPTQDAGDVADGASDETHAGVGQAQATRRRAVDEAVFHTRSLRNGRSFRVRWTDEDLKTNGARIAAVFKKRFLEEYTHLMHRVAVLEGQGSAPTVDIATVIAEAAKDAARVDARLALTQAPRGDAAPNGSGTTAR